MNQIKKTPKHNIIEPLPIMSPAIWSPGTRGAPPSMVCYFAHFEQSLKGLRSLCVDVSLKVGFTQRLLKIILLMNW